MCVLCHYADCVTSLESRLFFKIPSGHAIERKGFKETAREHIK